MHEHAYVARFGWTAKDLVLVPFSLLAIFVGRLMFVDGRTTVGALSILLGAAYLILTVTAWVSRRVALAVTAEGITLGQIPPWPASHSALVPWSDIEEIVLWRQGSGARAVRYIGIRRRADAPPMPGSAKSRTLRKLNKQFVPAQLSESLVADSRPVNFWRLNKTRLRAAVDRFGPDVPVVDQT